ncbi:hypothetical protein NDA13_002209 [Ustilago tritici]|nr:hypothetical protein NDA13_002209 [Ustilago tritici]
MQSGGGFIIDDLSTVFDEPSRSQLQQTTNATTSNADSVATPKQLTSKQEGKLRTFVDGALEDITRGYRKRFDPSSSLHTLSSYLAEWMRLLGVLAHVPPYGSGSTNLLISYLLRCSTDLCDGVTGYGLAMEIEAERSLRKKKEAEQAAGQDSTRNGGGAADKEATESDGEEDEDEEEERQHQIASRTKQLNLALQTIDLLDRIWAAVLRGNLINLPVALSNARRAFPDTPEAATDVRSSDGQRSHLPYHPRIVHSTSSLVPSPAIDDRFHSGSNTTHNTPRESLPIHGGRGNRTVGVTDQVRLRNIAISSREKLFSWMRTELDAPPPPIMDELDPEREPNDNTVQGIFGMKSDPGTAGEAGEDGGEEADFEDVEIGGEAEEVKEEGYDAEQDTEEHRHYQDLFESKLDPDEDDEDDQEAPAATGGDSDQTLGASVLGTVEAVTSNEAHDKRKREDSPDGEMESAEPEEQPRADGLPSKRPRATAAEADTDGDAFEAGAKMSRSEMESINFSLSDAIGQWDIAFTRLFSRTLRMLSDLSGGSNRAGKTDFATSLAGISGADEQEPADER